MSRGAYCQLIGEQTTKKKKESGGWGGLVVGGRPGPQSVIQSLETGPGQDLHTSSAGTRHLTLGNSEGGQLGSLRMEGEKV